MKTARLIAMGLAAALALMAGTTSATKGDSERVSVPNLADQAVLGEQANEGSNLPSINADGRFVAFASGASDLMIGDTNGAQDIFVHDRQTGVTERVSVPNLADQPSLGAECTAEGSSRPAISGDGRFVAFQSGCNNLIPADTNGLDDIYVHDRLTRATERVSVPNLADQPSLGAECTDQGSGLPAISGDGQFVAFQSGCNNLIPADTNGLDDVYVHDRLTGATERVSVPNLADQPSLGAECTDQGSGLPATSDDGQFIAFQSGCNNLIPADTNGLDDVYVHDRLTGATERVSVPNLADQATLGAEANCCGSGQPDISGDGRYVAFASTASNMVVGDTLFCDPVASCQDIFVHDSQTGATEWVSVPNLADQPTLGTKPDGPGGHSPAISANGRFATFASTTDNLVLTDTCCQDIFVHDRQTGATERVNIPNLADQATLGTECDSVSGGAGGGAAFPVINGDGRFVAFQSSCDNLVLDDSNAAQDTFAHDQQTGGTETLSVPNLADQATLGSQPDGSSTSPAISADGRLVAFTSHAYNLVLGDGNGADDVFVHDRQSGTTERVSVPNLTDQATLGSEANNVSSSPAISDGGRFVVYSSRAGNLVLADTNLAADVFVHDRQTGITERVSVPNLPDQATLGSEADNASSFPAISGDGRFVAFSSRAANLVLGDTNLAEDVFVHDRATGVTERVSVASDGTEGNDHSGSQGFATIDISDDGHFVAFASQASNLVLADTSTCSFPIPCRDIFVHDRLTGITERVSVPSLGDQSILGGQANDDSELPKITADGRFVVFQSVASNLVTGDTNAVRDVFVHDRQTRATERVSVPNLADQPTLGTECDQQTGVLSSSAISDDGRLVAFALSCRNLVSGDTNLVDDIFVHDRETRFTERVNIPNLVDQSTLGSQAEDHGSSSPAFSATGRFVAFQSGAPNLVVDDICCQDVFVHDWGVADADGDGVPDADDNCPNTPNPAQDDLDADGVGDACDRDDDGDGVPDIFDNCPSAANPDQEDVDKDGSGDACDSDDDGDGVPDLTDACPSDPPAGGLDADQNGCTDTIAGLKAIVEGLDLQPNIEGGLLAKLNDAEKALSKGKTKVAETKLQDFINQVQAQRGKALTGAEADLLVAYAENVILLT